MHAMEHAWVFVDNFDIELNGHIGHKTRTQHYELLT
jgi:hypothetical protein